jgi:hypothetical protein
MPFQPATFSYAEHVSRRPDLRCCTQRDWTKGGIGEERLRASGGIRLSWSLRRNVYGLVAFKDGPGCKSSSPECHQEPDSGTGGRWRWRGFPREGWRSSPRKELGPGQLKSVWCSAGSNSDRFAHVNLRVPVSPGDSHTWLLARVYLEHPILKIGEERGPSPICYKGMKSKWQFTISHLIKCTYRSIIQLERNLIHILDSHARFHFIHILHWHINASFTCCIHISTQYVSMWMKWNRVCERIKVRDTWT